MSGLTFITAGVIVWCVLRPGRFPLALALAGATPGGAALVLGSIGVPTFYAAALALALGLGLAILAGKNQVPEWLRIPGLTTFLAFLAWSLATTLVAPALFDGAQTVLPTGGHLIAGVLTSSNAAQIGYLALGILVFGYIATRRSTSIDLIGIATGGVVVLSLWRYLSINAGLPFPVGLFDNSPSAAIVETAPGGIVRFRGILSEPSALATYCLAYIAWAVSAVRQKGTTARIGLLGLAAAAAYLGVVSTSTTFLVAGLIGTALAGLIFLLGFLASRVRVGNAAIFIGVVLGLIALVVLPSVYSLISTVIQSKLGSSSYEERSGSDAASLQVFSDTFGIGVGLGANRGASFLPSLLGSVGIVGVLLFALAILTVVRNGAWDPDRRPAFWVLIVVFITKLTAGPDLSDPSGVMWISLGILAQVRVGGSTGQDQGLRAFEAARNAGPLGGVWARRPIR